MEILAELREEYKNQDNRCTARPIYVVVQELICIGVIADGYEVSCPYGDGETKAVFKFDDFEGVFDTKEELIEMLKEDGRENESHKIEELQLGYVWHPIEFFLTIKGAEEFMKADAHNRGRMRTYVGHIHRRNFEMRNLLEALEFRK